MAKQTSALIIAGRNEICRSSFIDELLWLKESFPDAPDMWGPNEAQPPSDADVLPLLRDAGPFPDPELLRFWRATKLDVQRAVTAIKTTAAWRTKKRVDELRDELSSPLLAGCFSSIGVDANGLPVYRLAPAPEHLTSPV